MLVAGLDAATCISFGGQTWQQITDSPRESRWQTIAVPGAAGARFLNGRFMAPSGTNTLFSSDGLSWEVVSTPTSQVLNAFCYGKGRYVGGGYFSFTYSLDGTNWVSQPAPMQV